MNLYFWYNLRIIFVFVYLSPFYKYLKIYSINIFLIYRILLVDK